MAVKKAAVGKRAVVKKVSKAAGVLVPRRQSPERPKARPTHVQLGFQLNHGLLQKIRGSRDFRATILNGVIPLPKRILDELREFHVVDTVTLNEHGIAMEVAVRFRSL